MTPAGSATSSPRSRSLLATADSAGARPGRRRGDDRPTRARSSCCRIGSDPRLQRRARDRRPPGQGLVRRRADHRSAAATRRCGSSRCSATDGSSSSSRAAPSGRRCAATATDLRCRSARRAMPWPNLRFAHRAAALRVRLNVSRVSTRDFGGDLDARAHRRRRRDALEVAALRRRRAWPAAISSSTAP